MQIADYRAVKNPELTKLYLKLIEHRIFMKYGFEYAICIIHSTIWPISITVIFHVSCMGHYPRFVPSNNFNKTKTNGTLSLLIRNELQSTRHPTVLSIHEA